MLLLRPRFRRWSTATIAHALRSDKTSSHCYCRIRSYSSGFRDIVDSTSHSSGSSNNEISTNRSSSSSGSSARNMGKSAAAAIRKALFEKDDSIERLNSGSQLSAGVIESMLHQIISSSRLPEAERTSTVATAAAAAADTAVDADAELFAAATAEAAAELAAAGGDFTAAIDFETLDLLTEQAQRLVATHSSSNDNNIITSGDSSEAFSGMRLLEDLMRFYLRVNKPLAAAAILLRCQRLQETAAATAQLASVSAPTCSSLMQQLVDGCHWQYAAYTAMYIIERDLDLPFRNTSYSSNNNNSNSSHINRYSNGSNNRSRDATATTVAATTTGVIRDSWLFHAVGGLMSHPAGVVLSLRLLQQIARKRRDDLARMFSFQKAALLSRSLNTSISLNFTQPSTAAAASPTSPTAATAAAGEERGTRQQRPQQLAPAALEDLSAELLSQQRQHGWFSHSLAKMLVSIAVAGGRQNIAASFVTQSLQIASDRAVYLSSSSTSNSSSGGGDSLLSQSADGATAAAALEASELVAMLRTFSQADGVVQQHAFFPHVSAQRCSAVTFALLLRFWCSSPLLQQVLLRQGPLTAMAFCNSSWVLAFRARDTHLLLPKEAQCISSEQLQQVDQPLRQLYGELIEFWRSSETSRDFCPSAGYERRAFRVLCDEFGFQHKVIDRSLATTTTTTAGGRSGSSYSSSSSSSGGNSGSNSSGGSYNRSNGSSGESLIVQVNKSVSAQQSLRVSPAPLEELLQRDLRLNTATDSRKFDALPLFWSTLRRYLLQMDAEQLSLLAHRQLNAMRNYPMLSWALLWLQLLRERNIPLHRGTLRSALKMCDRRSDLYGLLEVLHFAQQERSRGQQQQQQQQFTRSNNSNSNSSPEQQLFLRRLRQFNLQPQLASSSLSFAAAAAAGGADYSIADDADGSSADGSELFNALADNTAMSLYGDSISSNRSSNSSGNNNNKRSNAMLVDQLSAHDWNRACLLAFRGGKRADLPMHSYREAFTEVMVLMRRCGIDLENNSLPIILRFLVYSKHNPELLRRLCKRMYLDRSVFLSHVESIALTSVVLQQISSYNRCLSLSKPAYHSENYLLVFPDTQHKVSSLLLRAAPVLGTPFLRDFEHCWSNQQTKSGRQQLYSLLYDLLHPDAASSRRQQLLSAASGSQQQVREALSLVAVYAAYLVGARDGSYRRSFELLYLAHTLLHEGREADELARSFADDYEEEGEGRFDGEEEEVDISTSARHRRAAAAAAAAAEDGDYYNSDDDSDYDYEDDDDNSSNNKADYGRHRRR